MNELVTITEFQKLRVKFNKETGMYAIKHKKEYTHWLEQELVNNINYTRCSTELCTCKGLRTWFNTPKGLWCGDCDKKIRDKDTIT